MTLLTLAVVLGGLVQERTELKDVLPNGASIFMNRAPKAQSFSLCVAVSSPAPDTTETHGWRHLMEHLVAKGPNKDIDKRLESNGMVLLAHTTRDCVVFQVSGAPAGLDVALDALQELSGQYSFTADQIKSEVSVINEELALRGWEMELVADGWLRCYGESALDPFGSQNALAGASPEGLNGIVKSSFTADNISVSLTGSFDWSKGEAGVRKLAGAYPPGPGRTLLEPAPPAKRTALVGSSQGEAVVTAVGQVTDTLTLAALAAGFGTRALVPGSVVVYTPSQVRGLVTMAFPTSTGLSRGLFFLTGREQLVASVGLRQMQQWARETVSGPRGSSELSATSLVFRPGFSLSALEVAARAVTPADVRKVLADWVKEASGQ